MHKWTARVIAAAAMLAPVAAHAQDALTDVADTGDTAWILTSSAFVLLMTLPGLSLFYGGLVRTKNFLSVMVQIGAVAAMGSLLWILIGYTLAFGPAVNGWIGAGSNWMFNNLGNVREGLTVPESAFALFQMCFAAITPALMVGAWVDRARFSWVVTFCALWACWSMHRWPIGCGAAAGFRPSLARWILLAVSSSTPLRASPRWWPPR